jgi:hypothetical protein
VWNFTHWANVDTAGTDTRLVVRMYRVSDSTSYLMFTSTSPQITSIGTPQQLDWVYTQTSDIDFNTDDTLKYEIYALTDSTTLIDLDFYFEGNTHASYLTTPIFTGAAGTSGTSGSSGTSGVSGTSGSSGTSGINGTSGTSGSSGTSGNTPNIYVDSTSGDVYFYDDTRLKNLDVAIIQQDGGRNSNSVTNIYLAGEASTPWNLNGFVLPWNATLIAMSMSENVNTQTWTAEVRKNGSLTVLDSLIITNQYTNYNDSKNIDFNAGDRVQIYCNGTSIDYPHVTLFFRRRF